MQHRHRFKAYFTATVIGTLLASTCSQAWADDADKAKPLALRKIMQDLGKNMQGVTDGISREDWEMVGKIAPLIADHPQPPLVEKMRILKFVGTDAGKFKGYDEKTHEAAKALEQAAARSDGQSVISSFAMLQNSCLGCHQNFRKPFLEHFYGQR
jgi:cytochrome c556